MRCCICNKAGVESFSMAQLCTSHYVALKEETEKYYAMLIEPDQRAIWKLVYPHTILAKVRNEE